MSFVKWLFEKEMQEQQKALEVLADETIETFEEYGGFDGLKGIVNSDKERLFDFKISIEDTWKKFVAENYPDFKGKLRPSLDLPELFQKNSLPKRLPPSGSYSANLYYLWVTLCIYVGFDCFSDEPSAESYEEATPLTGENIMKGAKRKNHAEPDIQNGLGKHKQKKKQATDQVDAQWDHAKVPGQLVKDLCMAEFAKMYDEKVQMTFAQTLEGYKRAGNQYMQIYQDEIEKGGMPKFPIEDENFLIQTNTKTIQQWLSKRALGVQTLIPPDPVGNFDIKNKASREAWGKIHKAKVATWVCKPVSVKEQPAKDQSTPTTTPQQTGSSSSANPLVKEQLEREKVKAENLKNAGAVSGQLIKEGMEKVGESMLEAAKILKSGLHGSSLLIGNAMLLSSGLSDQQLNDRLTRLTQLNDRMAGQNN